MQRLFLSVILCSETAYGFCGAAGGVRCGPRRGGGLSNDGPVVRAFDNQSSRPTAGAGAKHPYISVGQIPLGHHPSIDRRVTPPTRIIPKHWAALLCIPCGIPKNDALKRTHAS